MPTFIAGKDNKVLFGAFDLSYFSTQQVFQESKNEWDNIWISQATYIQSTETATASLVDL